MSTTHDPPKPTVFDDRLLAGMQRAGEFFVGDSPVVKAAKKLAKKFEELNIPYAVVGAMALNAHGYERATSDIDYLVTDEGLRAFKDACLGLGYVERFPGSKGVRDVEWNVPIDFLKAGEFPGDGRPQPIAFPDPEGQTEGGKFGKALKLDRLLELKIASGLSAPHRLKDLADVMETIKVLRLPRDFAERVHPHCRGKFVELWTAAQGGLDEDY